MNARSLRVLCGVGAPLILTGAASAGFTGVKVVQKKEAEAFGLFVCNVYATFDRPDDEMAEVHGRHDFPLNIFVKNGVSFQHAQGQPLTAPFLQFLPGNPPTLAYDTFITIGTKVNDLFSTLDDTSPTPGVAFAVGTNIGGPTNMNNGPLNTTSGAWFIIPSGPGNGGLGAPNANGQVLLGQFTVVKGTGATGVAGTMLLLFTSNGVTGQQAYVEFDHQIPAPGALAILGLGGAVGSRRRRRCA